MIHFILGGARSGKSSFAEKEVASHNRTVTYIATATADDEEMKRRIAHHQDHRPSSWKLIEEPYLLSDILEEYNKGDSVILIDCLTLWLSNWLCKKDDFKVNRNWEQEQQLFLNNLKNSDNTIYIVSNEVGSGIVPMGELTRDFVDRAGWLNQAVARFSDSVTLVVAGMPLVLKEESISNVQSSKNRVC